MAHLGIVNQSKVRELAGLQDRELLSIFFFVMKFLLLLAQKGSKDPDILKISKISASKFVES